MYEIIDIGKKKIKSIENFPYKIDESNSIEKIYRNKATIKSGIKKLTINENIIFKCGDSYFAIRKKNHLALLQEPHSYKKKDYFPLTTRKYSDFIKNLGLMISAIDVQYKQLLKNILKILFYKVLVILIILSYLDILYQDINGSDYSFDNSKDLQIEIFTKELKNKVESSKDLSVNYLINDRHQSLQKVKKTRSESKKQVRKNRSQSQKKNSHLLKFITKDKIRNKQ